MGLEIALAAASLAVTVKAGSDARKQARQAAVEQGKARSEQAASNAANAAAERRQQIREERVKRARILQSAENTGVSGSSGEAGAVGSLSTQLGANIGFNLGMLDRAGNIGDFQQNAADSTFAMNQSIMRGQDMASIFNIGAKIAPTIGATTGNIFASDPLGDFTQRSNRGSGD